MKKTVLVFGLISGALMSAMMLATVPFADRIGFDKGVVVGYTTMVLSFLLVFFGVKSYRENVGGGAITFGRALAVGLLIALVSCVCYVVTWEIVYFKLMPDFVNKYAAYVVEKARASGASEQAIQAQIKQMRQFKAMYDNPLINAAFTFLEPLPIALIFALLSAAILRRKRRDSQESPNDDSVALPTQRVVM